MFSSFPLLFWNGHLPVPEPVMEANEMHTFIQARVHLELGRGQLQSNHVMWDKKGWFHKENVDELLESRGKFQTGKTDEHLPQI